jgi:hypothetical protein
MMHNNNNIGVVVMFIVALYAALVVLLVIGDTTKPYNKCIKHHSHSTCMHSLYR